MAYPQPAPFDSWPMVNLGTEAEVGKLFFRPGTRGQSVVGKQVPFGQWVSPQQLKNGDALVVRAGDTVAIISSGSIQLPSDRGNVALLQGEAETRISIGAQLTTMLGDKTPQTVREVVLVSGTPYVTTEAMRASENSILKDFAKEQRVGRPGVRSWNPLEDGKRLIDKLVLVGRIEDRADGRALVGTLSNLGTVSDSFGHGGSFGGLVLTKNSVYSYDNKGRIRHVVAPGNEAKIRGHATFDLSQVRAKNGSAKEFDVTLAVGKKVLFAPSGHTSPVEAIVTNLQLMSVEKAYEVTGGAELPASYPAIDATQLIAASRFGPVFGER